jgi:hypothetical protein
MLTSWISRNATFADEMREGPCPTCVSSLRDGVIPRVALAGAGLALAGATPGTSFVGGAKGSDRETGHD